MKKIKALSRNDAHHIRVSVVAIITIMGLCIVPCLYAWFNIFSNWAPYGNDSTSRIKVSVASVDRGASILGKKLNVGDQVMTALEANSQIGWVFCDSEEEALEKVYSSDCYAALIVPEDFSENIVSFLSLDFVHPELIYYENGKKNAIAPKITGQAKTAVQQEVNATFLQTLVSAASEIISIMDANGIDAETLVKNLSSAATDLNEKLDDCSAMLVSLANLTGATRSMMLASSSLVINMSDSMGLSGDLVSGVGENLAQMGTSIHDIQEQIKQDLGLTRQNTQLIARNYRTAAQSPEEYNKFVENSAQTQTELNNLQSQTQTAAELNSALGYTSVSNELETAAAQIGELSQMTGELAPIDPNDPDQWAEAQVKMQQAADKAAEVDDSILRAAEASNIVSLPTIQDNFDRINASMQNLSQLLDGLQIKVYNAGATLYNLSTALGTLNSGLYQTLDSVNEAREKLTELADFLEALSESKFLAEVIDILREGEDVLDSHVASPIKVEDKIMFPAEQHYGSQMAAFYTMLAQWVGALFCAVLLKTHIVRGDEPENMNVVQHYLGRYAVFLFVGVAQALIVSLGDVLYVDIVCAHPGLLVLASVVAGICFVTINYMLVYTLGAAGLAVSVIVMLVQVAGAGGTFPVEVLPKVFGYIYPYMPFKFGMNAMREAVSGLYQGYYLHNILVLVGITLGTFPVAALIYRPAKLLNDILEKAKKQSKIMT